jgi:hypothetical protein
LVDHKSPIKLQLILFVVVARFHMVAWAVQFTPHNLVVVLILQFNHLFILVVKFHTRFNPVQTVMPLAVQVFFVFSFPY